MLNLLPASLSVWVVASALAVVVVAGVEGVAGEASNLAPAISERTLHHHLLAMASGSGQAPCLEAEEVSYMSNQLLYSRLLCLLHMRC